MIENIKVGHDFLYREFNVTPKVAWHADAFGHSAETSKIFKQLGFEALIFGRLTEKYKLKLLEQKDMAFIWNPSFEGVDSQYKADKGLYSHMLYRLYLAPCDVDMKEIKKLTSFNFDEFISKNLQDKDG